MQVRSGSPLGHSTAGQAVKPAWMAVALAAGLGLAAAPTLAVDWDAVDGKTITLFAPGQASFEWVMTQSDHSGAGRFREGRNCMHCHEGEQQDIGDIIVQAQGRGAALEPKPVAGKPGAVDLDVRTALAGENLLVRLQWQEVPYDGGRMDPDHAARITMMFDDGTVREAGRAGCWGTCHDDAIGMASDPDGADLTKYLFASRSGVSRSGGGENYKPDAEIQDLLSKGVFMEYWQARLNPGQRAQAIEGYVLDRRHEQEATQVSAEAQYDAGTWTVVLSRPLQAAGHHKNLVAGKTYNVGFALHNNHADHRFHHVSLEYTLSVDGGSGELVAVKR